MNNFCLKLNKKGIYFLLFITLLFARCSPEEKTVIIIDTSYAVFLQDTVTVVPSGGDVFAQMEWLGAVWKIIMDDDNGWVEDISQKEGGADGDEKGQLFVKFTCTENKTAETRQQEVFLVNKSKGERSKLVIKQGSNYSKLSITLNVAVKYQRVAGFGGMCNPVIWTPSNLISKADLTKMFAPDQLGYNILRLMVYPEERHWPADVERAKEAQAYGALVFASPWHLPSDMEEKIIVNGKEMRHLKPDRYQDYANHLVNYIHHMKNNGVELYAISVQNEPDMDFTYWRPQEVVNFIKTYGDQIRATGVRLMAPEHCGFGPEHTDPVLNDPIAFSKTDIVAGHLYQGFVKVSESSYVHNRHAYITGLYNSKLANSGKEWSWWMTEHLFNTGESETNPALWQFQKWSYMFENLGKEIHTCMEGYCSAYIYWYLKRFYGMIGDTDRRSPVPQGVPLKNGYILSHYAKYASNTTRIKADSDNKDVNVTAYVNHDGTEITIVLLNFKNTNFKMVTTTPFDIVSATAVETSETADMKTIEPVVSDNRKNVSLNINPQSMVSIRLRATD